MDDGVRVIAVSDLSILESHAGAWNQLALSMGAALPMVSHAWVASYFEHQLRPGEKWLCLLAYRDDKLLGVLPLLIIPHSIWGIRSPRLRMPGNYDTVSVDAVLSESDPEKVFGYLLFALRKAFPSFQSLEFSLLPEKSATLALSGRMAKYFFVVSESAGFGNYIRIDGTYEKFLDDLSHNFRRNLKKNSKKIEQLPNLATDFHGGGELECCHLATFLDIEASGWKGKAGTSIRQSPSLKAFYEALDKRLRKLGWLEYHFLRSGDKAIAGHLAVRFGRTLVLTKIGYDEAYAQGAPGNYLFDKNLRRAFERHDTDLIDCLSDEPWHHNWNACRRPYYNLYLYPRRIIPAIFGLIPRKIHQSARKIPILHNLYHRIRREKSKRKWPQS
jgi:Acetyltransferase (GNAT) domain